MARRGSCAACGKPMWRGTSSLPQGEATCQPCRRARHGSSSAYQAGCRCEACRAYKSARNRRAAEARAAREGRVLGPMRRRGLGPDPFANQRKMASKRARKAAAFVEVVDPARVFERDGWRCHICKRRCRRGRGQADPRAATLDHLVPLSRGGEHSYANVATACRECNTRKGNRAANDQLALVG